MSPAHPSSFFLLLQSLLFIFAALEFLDALIVVVDCGGEGAFGAVLADDEGVEMLF